MKKISKNKKGKSILFVCTGNIFRSMSPEYCFKKYLEDNGIKGWRVGSAGTVAKKSIPDPKTLETLARFGITKVNHKQRKLNKKIVKDYDIIVALAQNHYDFIKNELGHKQVLYFNELALGEPTSIWDIGDKVKDFRTNRKAVEKVIENTVKEIHKKIPSLYKRADERFYLFEDSTDGKISHRNGYPFIKLYETKNSVFFMSVDIPSKTDGHILAIPKKRFADFSEVPNSVLKELLSGIKHIGKALNVRHGGYNILLNNGLDAGQYILHAHFHIIPRNFRDGIKIELWKHRKISRKEFIELNKSLKEAN